MPVIKLTVPDFTRPKLSHFTHAAHRGLSGMRSYYGRAYAPLPVQLEKGTLGNGIGCASCARSRGMSGLGSLRAIGANVRQRLGVGSSVRQRLGVGQFVDPTVFLSPGESGQNVASPFSPPPDAAVQPISDQPIVATVDVPTDTTLTPPVATECPPGFMSDGAGGCLAISGPGVPPVPRANPITPVPTNPNLNAANQALTNALTTAPPSTAAQVTSLVGSTALTAAQIAALQAAGVQSPSWFSRSTTIAGKVIPNSAIAIGIGLVGVIALAGRKKRR